jgi:hypothetical protein
MNKFYLPICALVCIANVIFSVFHCNNILSTAPVLDVVGAALFLSVVMLGIEIVIAFVAVAIFWAITSII